MSTFLASSARSYAPLASPASSAAIVRATRSSRRDVASGSTSVAAADMLPAARRAISAAGAGSTPRAARSSATTASGSAPNRSRSVRDRIVGSSASGIDDTSTKHVRAPGSSSVLSSALAAELLSSSARRTMNTFALPSMGANADRASTTVRIWSMLMSCVSGVRRPIAAGS